LSSLWVHFEFTLGSVGFTLSSLWVHFRKNSAARRNNFSENDDVPLIFSVLAEAILTKKKREKERGEKGEED